MNKKIMKILIPVVVVLVLTGIIILISKLVTKNETNNDYTNIKILNIEMLKEKIDNKDSFVLVVSRDDCSHCKAYIPVLNKVGQEYNLTFYDVSQTDLSNEDLTYLRNIANVTATPTTVFIIDGEEKNTQNRLVGEAKEYRIIEKLKAMGYINE